jgi:hypothetical protein
MVKLISINLFKIIKPAEGGLYLVTPTGLEPVLSTLKG